MIAGARMRDRTDALAAFERAVAVEPDSALPWLWLATATDRLDVVDARIDVALDLDLGGQAWRTACGELLMVLGLRRLPARPDRARAILLEATYVLPKDARAWVAMAASSGTAATRAAYLERAIELNNIDQDAVRWELVRTIVAQAMEHVEDDRTAAARDTLVRATSWAPAEPRLWALAVQLAQQDSMRAALMSRALTVNAGDHGFAVMLRAALGRPSDWSVRTRFPQVGRTDADPELQAELAQLSNTLAARSHLVESYRSRPFCERLLRSAIDLTASVLPEAASRPALGPGETSGDRHVGGFRLS